MEETRNWFIIIAFSSIFSIPIVVFCFILEEKFQQNDPERLTRTSDRQEYWQTLDAQLRTLVLRVTERRQLSIGFLNFMEINRPPEPNPSGPDHHSSARTEERIKLIEQSLCTTEVNEEKESVNLAHTLKLTTQPQTKTTSSSCSKDSYSLSLSAIESLESKGSSNTNNIGFSLQLECSVCLQAYKKGEQIAWAKTDKCNHIFHKNCIQMWLTENDDCPLCRFQILGGDDNNV